MPQLNTRRDFLRRGMFAAGILIGPSLLAACAPAAAPPRPGADQPARGCANRRASGSREADDSAGGRANDSAGRRPDDRTGPGANRRTSRQADNCASRCANGFRQRGNSWFELLGRRAEKGHAGRLRRVHQEDRHPVDVNTMDHNAFQEQINTYLQGTPDDVFTWFAGYRMQFFAAQGLADARSTTCGRRSAATSPTR